ncbi:MAG: LamG domain-containing protein [Planctomycetes bacterium]|nr:LamG domain-containing protein [Planctomycetota bacterium]
MTSHVSPLKCLVLILLGTPLSALIAQEPKRDKTLIGHWPLVMDAKDVSGAGHDLINRGVRWEKGNPGAVFDGRQAHLELPAKHRIAPGRGDFSLALWVNTPAQSDDLPGDIASLYDAKLRSGFHLTIRSSAVTASQANARHLQFSIDNAKESKWLDCGRPGNATFAFALATFAGKLYAGTCEPGKNESGRVYRYAGEKRWIDCGSPAPCNSVTALAVHDGKLFAGVGKYRLAGSALKESENLKPGGRVFRYDGDSKWIDCGQLLNTEAIGGFVVFRGKLYASSLYKPAGFYRYEGDTKWTDCGTPGGKRVVALAVHDGFIYASSYDGGRIYRYDGKTWTDCGQLGENTQTYSFAVHHGRLYVGTWPSGRVFRFVKVGRWEDVGQLGNEKEVMGMIVHNGRLLAGTLPLAEVYQFEADQQWKKLARLDFTPDVRYRRAWTAAEHQGRVYFSTLPSGKIHAFQAGATAAWEGEFPSGWRHIAAVKRGGALELFVDGKRVAVSEKFTPGDYDLNADHPLRIGAGSGDFFLGQMRDVRLYQRSLNPAEVAALARR